MAADFRPKPLAPLLKQTRPYFDRFGASLLLCGRVFLSKAGSNMHHFCGAVARLESVWWAQRRRRAFLWYFLELKGVTLGTAGWLTMGPEHMTAATWGAFEQHDRPLVRLKFSLAAGVLCRVRGSGGALSREGPCGRGDRRSSIKGALLFL